MSSTTVRFRASIAVGVAAGLLLMAACAGSAQKSVASAPAHPGVPAPARFTMNKNALLHPARKYYGISMAGVPATVTTPISTVTKETKKRPNLVMYYQEWGAGAAKGKPNFNTTDAENACAAGLLPMLTWESWNTLVTNPTQGVAWTQPAFAMSKIVAGDFDPYIKRVAEAIASIGCPIAMRFDQEQNGYWYPWGISNVTENGNNEVATAHEYIRMWRHVRRIFTSVGATNVLWLWSPNIQGPHAPLPNLATSYPGKKWVDWVGIDGYYNTPQRTFSNLFGPTMKLLAKVAPLKPWIIAETGVGSSARKPAQIKNLLNGVLRHKRLNGFVYFEQHKKTDRSFWPFVDPTYPGSLRAFRAGIDRAAYASGKPGDKWYTR
jgi:hypothetical protein